MTAVLSCTILMQCQSTLSIVFVSNMTLLILKGETRGDDFVKNVFVKVSTVKGEKEKFLLF